MFVEFNNPINVPEKKHNVSFQGISWKVGLLLIFLLWAQAICAVCTYFSNVILICLILNYWEFMCREGNQAFREAMALLEKHPRVRGLSFTSFLILPFQRITRLKLLVQVSKHTNKQQVYHLVALWHCVSLHRISSKKQKKTLRGKQML